MAESAGTQEIELKLRLPAAAVRRLSAHPLLRGAEPVTRTLHTVYYDTARHELRRRGVALRVRREGARWVQTLKAGGAAAGGLHRRLEIEREVPGEDLDFEMLGMGPYAALFASERLRRRLRPVFITRFTRSERRLELPHGLVIDAAIDRGTIASAGRRVTLCEMELELKSGPPAALYAFARGLAKTVPLVIENRTKAERGYALHRSEAARPEKARTVALDRGMTAAAAFEAVIWTTLDHLQRNTAGMLAGRDPEYLHQMRVALRRMRSAFRVFAPLLPGCAVEPLIEEMRWLARELGPARDWDVFVAETLPQVAGKIRPAAVRAALERAARRRRREANRCARRAVDSDRYRLYLLSLAGWLAAGEWARTAGPGAAELTRPVASFAVRALERRRAKARKRGRRLAAQTPARRHRLRIAIKKLRYAGDFFSGLFARGGMRRAVRKLARLQDILGAMNDTAAAALMLDECCARLPRQSHAQARRALAAWTRSRAPALERELKRAWTAFRKHEQSGRGMAWN